VKKGYINRADNAEFTLTAEGVDFIETQRGQIPILNKMLTTGSVAAEPTLDPMTGRPQRYPGAPIVLPSRMELTMERRIHHTDRLLASEVAVDTLDRRESSTDRRRSPRGRRSTD